MKNTSNSNNEFLAAAYDYNLPPELIAQEPAARREDSRLLILDRKTDILEHRFFRDILEYLTAKDLLIFNDTRVWPARLLGQKKSGAQCEIFLLKQLSDTCWEVLAKPGRRLPVDSEVIFAKDFNCRVADVLPDGRRIVEFNCQDNFWDNLARYGQIPLPPYIKPVTSTTHIGLRRSDRAEIAARYQTVYAREIGSSAAPTAGLHFSEELLAKIRDKKIATAFVTLHIGLGTFQPLQTEDIREHQIHTEAYSLPASTIQAIQDCRRRGGRVIAVGTTAARVLETEADSLTRDTPHRLKPELPLERGANLFYKTNHSQTNIFIYPGYRFKVVDALITNFHLPRSTLLLLVSALAGRERILSAYQEAIRQKYRFFSFGDAMLIV